ELLDVGEALRVTAPRRVRVRELVDEHERRPAGQDGVDVHLLEDGAAVVGALPRDDLEAAEERLRLRAPGRLDHTDTDLQALADALAASMEHRIRLPPPGRGADEDLEAAPVFSRSGFEKRFGGRPALVFEDAAHVDAGECVTAPPRRPARAPNFTAR